ncbi:MAG: CoA-binding protein [Chloroflexi bacterium]|nr:CoA-binding protein [Chloroflexota bacterium]
MGSKLEELAPLFYPRSLALIGASSDDSKFGGRFLRSVLRFGFKGELYLVNPRESEILGMRTYPSILDVPHEVDLAGIAVPAKAVPQVLEECLAKGVKGAEIITSGFGETGTEDGRELQERIREIAKRGIRVIGPNCFGVYSPAGTLTVLPGGDFSRESGPVGFTSQSGVFLRRFPKRAEGLGIRFSKAIGYGNAVDINEADLYEYLAEDLETRVIASYMEGAREARRFFEVLRRTTPTKPVILWKGGLTAAGARAAASHTGTLAGEEAIWEAVFRQTGATRVTGLDELMDAVLVFLHLPSSCGPRVAIVGGGGGTSVGAADACERAGLRTPPLAPELQKRLAASLAPVGTSTVNPVDVGTPFPAVNQLRATLDILIEAPNVDTIILDAISVYAGFNGEDTPEVAQAVVDIRKSTSKPIVAVLPVEATGVDDLPAEAKRRRTCDYYHANGIPVFLTLERAVSAVAKGVRYRQWVSAHGGDA